jgi:hypothetical protein
MLLQICRSLRRIVLEAHVAMIYTLYA